MQTILALLLTALPIVSFGANFRQEENLRIDGNFTNVLFMAGEKIDSTVTSSDDVFMAAGKINPTGEIKANLFSAGGKIRIQDSQSQLALIAGGDVKLRRNKFNDLILAAGEIDLSDTDIVDDAILAGGEIDISKNVRVHDSLVAAGGEIRFSGHADGDVSLAGGKVVIDGIIEKNLRVQANEVILTANAQIKGNFIHGVQDLEIHQGAVIGGQTIVRPAWENKWAQKNKAWAPLALAIIAFWFLLIPSLSAAIFRNFVIQSAAQLRRDFLKSLGVGFLIAVLLPVIWVLLIISVLGIPAAILLIPMIIAAKILIWSMVSFVIGQQLYRWLGKPSSDLQTLPSRMFIFLWTLLGSFILMLTLLIPVVGLLAVIVLFFAGWGSSSLAVFGKRAGQ